MNAGAMPEKQEDNYRWIALTIASIGTLPVWLDSSFNIAFPAITSAFHLDVSLMQWAVIAYVLTTASMMLGCGRLADVFGRKRVFVIGLGVVTVALALCGLAPTYGFLLFFRAIQGVAAALISASAPAIVAVAFPPGQLGRALGIMNMVGFAGQTGGPIVGGALVDRFSWRGIFLFRVPIALATMLFAMPFLRESADREHETHFDLAGAATLALSVVGFLLVLNRGRALGWFSPQVMMLAAGSTAVFCAFVFTENHAKQPVVDLSLLTPGLTLANLASLLANLAMFAVWLLVPYYIVEVLHYPATSGGTLLAPCPLGMALAAPLSGFLADRFGTRRLQAPGLAVEAVGLLLTSRLGPDASYVSVVLALILIGLGLGMFTVANMKYVMGAIARERQGVAAGLVSMMRTLGVVAGVNIAAEVFSARRAVHIAALSQTHLPAAAVTLNSFIAAFGDAFRVSTAVCLVAMVLSLIPARTAPHNTAIEAYSAEDPIRAS
jgi:EmrB/QacA subfamily drug resistance transporter